MLVTRQLLLATAVACGAAVPARPALAQEASALERTTLEGVFAEAQARRGAETYRKHCTECHVPAAVTGVVFHRAWAGRTVYDYYELIRSTMPNDNPGKLSRSQYADIVAYLLQLSGLPAGERPLPHDTAVLRHIKIEIPAVPSR